MQPSSKHDRQERAMATGSRADPHELASNHCEVCPAHPMASKRVGLHGSPVAQVQRNPPPRAFHATWMARSPMVQWAGNLSYRHELKTPAEDAAEGRGGEGGQSRSVELVAQFSDRFGLSRIRVDRLGKLL
jgi:hypothetical protein